MKRYLLFLILNAAMVCLAVYFFMPGKRTGAEELLWDCFIPAILIIALQYFPLIRYKNWIWKMFVFYLSMVLFFVVLALINSWDSKVGAYAAGAWMARLDAVVRTVVVGHYFGAILYPLVVFCNWLFRKQIFPQGPSKA